MKKSAHTQPQIEVTKDGPYLVSGGLPLRERWIVTNTEGDSLEYREGKKFSATPQYALCRCGQSANKPFCDGSTRRFISTARKRPAMSLTRSRPKRLMVPRYGSPTSRTCAHSPGSVIRKAKSGIWSSWTPPRPGKLSSTRQTIVPPD